VRITATRHPSRNCSVFVLLQSCITASINFVSQSKRYDMQTAPHSHSTVQANGKRELVQEDTRACVP
jgi:hypothetical protein